MKRHPEPIPDLAEPLAVSTDDSLSIVLDWIIVKNGPGSWAKNADWDEYLLRARATTEATIKITAVSVYDSLGTRLGSMNDRHLLKQASRETVKRYKAKELSVKPGWGTGQVFAGNAGAVGGGYASAAAVGGWGGVGIAMATVAFVPVALGAVMVHDAGERNVGRALPKRATTLPVSIASGEPARLNVFFPFAPSPEKLEVRYELNGSPSILEVDISEATSGLHLRQARDP